MNASHFRNRAQKARELARTGDDSRLVEMLLEVARDMDAEADAIEAAARSGIAGPQARTAQDAVSPSIPVLASEAQIRQTRDMTGYPAAARTKAHTVAA